jgi:hypothetical protein
MFGIKRKGLTTNRGWFDTARVILMQTEEHGLDARATKTKFFAQRCRHEVRHIT